jgi:hypothetical protein
MTRRSFAVASTLVAGLAVGVSPLMVSVRANPPQGSQAGSPTCIAIVLPSATGAAGDATEFATSLRDLFVSYLTGPSLRAIALEARLASQAMEEARQKDCGNVLLTSIERKRNDGSGWGRALGRAAGTAAWYGVPYGGTAATAAARGAAVAGAHAISTMAETTRAKDEVTLEFRVGTPDAALRATPRSQKAKAKSDGEDLLTPLVEKASEAIAAAVLKR